MCINQNEQELVWQKNIKLILGTNSLLMGQLSLIPGNISMCINEN